MCYLSDEYRFIQESDLLSITHIKSVMLYADTNLETRGANWSLVIKDNLWQMPKAFLNGSVGKDVWVLFNPLDMGASDKLKLQWPGTSIVPSKNIGHEYRW